MSDPYIGEIRLFAGTYAPVGWAICDGQLLPIADNDTYFALVGTTYGGDGETTFAVPDLRGRVPVGHGQSPGGTSYPIGTVAGAEEVALTQEQLPPHTHQMTVSTAGGTADNPDGAMLATNTSVVMYIRDVLTSALPASIVGSAGGAQPHSNLMPTTSINYIVALFGTTPSPTS
jgi:microcystin-dependent protein